MDQLLMWLGYPLCHQLPERSFIALGHQVPVCARDTGLYLGFAVSMVLLGWLGRRRRPASLPPLGVLALAGLLFATMAFDGVSSYAGWRATTNDLRLLTGLAAGFALTTVTMPMLSGQLWTRPSAERVLGSRREVLAWLLALPVTFAIVRWVLPFLGLGFALVVVGAIIFTFGAVNLTMVCLTPWFERKTERLRTAWRAMMIAFVLTALELGLTALLRAALERFALGA